MKKVLSLIVVALVIFTVGNAVVFAEYAEGDEQIPNGDFSFNAGELAFPDPVFGPEFGPAEGWGSLAFDSHAIAMQDPDDATNTVLKLSMSDDGEAWSSFFRFLTINTGTVYDVSIDYKLVGTTDNMGFRFAGSPPLELVFLDHASKTAIPDKTDWYNVEFQFDTTDGSYDSIALWFHTLGSVDNYLLLDNITIMEEGTTENINVGGDFEGFLDYAPGLELTETVDSNGYFGTNASFANNNARINTDGYLAYEHDFNANLQRATFDFTIDDLTNGDATIAFYDETDTAIISEEIITAGVISDLVTESDGTYQFQADMDLTDAASYIRIDYSGDSMMILDNLSVKELVEIPDNPFDPDTTYYEIDQLVVNGDFEAFDVDTAFSEEQLEGAWGSISLDGPAKIESVDGSKVMALGSTSGKAYTSSFVMSPPDLMVGDLLRLRYDYKLDIESPIDSYTAIDSSFVGASNEPYYVIDLSDVNDMDNTVGEELLSMPISVTQQEDGWATVEVDFAVTTEFLIKTNSLRFLFTPLNDNDSLYIDNVTLSLLSDVEPDNNVTNLEINESDQELTVGEEVTLTSTITPEDADNAVLEWSSEDESVATVDNSGTITAINEGATTIYLELEDGSLSDSIVVTVFALEEEATGCFSSIALTGVTTSIMILVGGVVFVTIRKKGQ